MDNEKGKEKTIHKTENTEKILKLYSYMNQKGIIPNQAELARILGIAPIQVTRMKNKGKKSKDEDLEVMEALARKNDIDPIFVYTTSNEVEMLEAKIKALQERVEELESNYNSDMVMEYYKKHLETGKNNITKQRYDELKGWLKRASAILKLIEAAGQVGRITD